MNYSGLDDHPDHALVARYLSGTAAALLTFGVKDGRLAGARFQDALQLFTCLVNIGDDKSLAILPSHRPPIGNWMSPNWRKPELAKKWFVCLLVSSISTISIGGFGPRLASGLISELESDKKLHKP